MIRRIFPLSIAASLLASFPAFCVEPTLEETLFVRRILEFWKEQELDLVRSQISLFLTQHPESSFSDQLSVLLGNLEYSHGRYAEAAAAFHHVKAPNAIAEILPKKLDSLYRLKRWKELVDAAEGFVLTKNSNSSSSEEERLLFYYAEAACQLGKNTLPGQETLLEKSQQAFENLMASTFKEHATIRLAEIHAAKGNPKHAVELYQSLLSSTSGICSREDLLFKIGQLQTRYDQQKAMETFALIAADKGKYSSDATENQILILFESGQYETLVDSQNAFRKAIAQEKLPFVDLFIARSYFAMEKYAEAKALLEQHPSKDFAPPQDKVALLTLIASAAHLHDIASVEKWSTQFQQQYPSDQDGAKVLYFQAVAYAKGGHFEDARATLLRTLNEFPQSEQKDAIQLELILLSYQEQRWEEAHGGLKLFLREKPKAPQQALAAHYLTQATMQQIKYAEEPVVLKEQLLEDLAFVITCEVGEEQKESYLLQTAKTLYELGRYQEAVDLLKTFIADRPTSRQLFQAHYLLAMCYEDGLHLRDAFIAHAEKVLVLKPDFTGRGRIHMSLFGAYLQLAKENDPEGERHTQYVDLAASHLFRASEAQASLKQEHLLWLANYDYHRVQAGLDEYFPRPITDPVKQELAKRAIVCFEKALEIAPLEAEIIKLSCLYGWMGCCDEQIELLQQLVQWQQENPDGNCKFKERALFSLAQACEDAGLIEQALGYYQELIEKPLVSDAHAYYAGKLQYARLAFSSLPEEKKNIHDSDVQAILAHLKDLQIRKTFAQEPLHLEAAIDYAFLRASLENGDKHDQLLLQLFTRAKEDFSSKEGIWAREYDANRQQDPEKNRLYQAYLMLMDAHIAFLESQMAEKERKLCEQELKLQAAKALFRTLSQEEFAMTPYLAHQALSGISLTTTE